MKAIVIRDDRSLSWEEVEYPMIRPHEVLIRTFCAGVNRADLMQRAGQYPPPPDCPPWMGLEVSGEIEAMGREAATESGWKVGDRVCALLGGGGYAQFVSVPYGMVMPVPEGVSMEEAAALPEAFATSYLNLVLEGHAKPGETFLMPGGTSGLASVAIPMAKALGLRVLTTARTPEKAERIRDLGADRVICTAEEKLCDVLEEEEKAGHPVDLVMDCVGGEDVGACLPYMNRGGRWIMIATLGGDMASVDLKTMYKKHLSLSGSTLRSRSPEEKAGILKALVKDFWPFVSEGSLRPRVSAVLDITRADEAQSLLSQSRSNGKVVLRVR